MMMDENKNNAVKNKFLTELSLAWNSDNQNNVVDNLNTSSNGYSNIKLLSTNLDVSQNSTNELCQQIRKDLVAETSVIINLLTSNDSCKSTNDIENNSTGPITMNENTTQLRLSPLVGSDTQDTQAPVNVQLNDAVINLDCDDSVVNAIEFNAKDISLSSEALDNDEGVECKGQEEEEEKSNNFSEVSPTSSGESSLDSGVVSLDDVESSNAKTSQETVEESGQLPRPSPFVSNSNFPSTPYEAKLLRKRRSNLYDSCWPQTKRKKSLSKIVSFKGVTVYYFSRKQSFVTVPSQGGSTLGMGLKHIYSKDMTINQHKRSILRRRRFLMKEQKRQQQIDARIKQLKQKYPGVEAQQLMSMVSGSEPESEESSTSDEDDNDVLGICEEEEDHSTEDEYFFLQPIPTKKRRLMLRMAGVQKIDSEEKLTNRMTRESREICGCDCEGVCLPSTCQCHLNGIPCQVDRESFPCGCQLNRCHNESGRIEFDSERVKHHYIHTMRQIRLEETGINPVPEETSTGAVQPKRSPYVNLDLHDTNTTRAQDLSALNTNNNSMSHIESTHSFEKHVQFAESPTVSQPYCNTSNQWNPNYCDSMNNLYYNTNNNCAQQYFSEVNNNSTTLPEQNYSLLQLGFNPGNEGAALKTTHTEGLKHPELYQYLSPSYSDFKEPVSRFGATVSKVSYPPVENCPNNSDTQFKLDPIASFLPLTTAVPLSAQEGQVPDYTTGLNNQYRSNETQQASVYQQTISSDKEVPYRSNPATESTNCPPLLSECASDTINVFS